MAADLKGFQKLAWYYQVLAVGLVSGGLLGLFWYQFLSPMSADIVTKEEQLKKLNEELATSRKQAAVFEQFKRESEQLAQKLESLKSILPQAKETDQILRLVQSAATASSLRILRVAPRAVVDREVYTEWPIDMEVIGTYHNIGMFLDKIRQLPRIVNIAGLRITARAGAESSFSVGATYTATTFVYREEQPPAGAK